MQFILKFSIFKTEAEINEMKDILETYEDLKAGLISFFVKTYGTVSIDTIMTEYMLNLYNVDGVKGKKSLCKLKICLKNKIWTEKRAIDKNNYF